MTTAGPSEHTQVSVLPLRFFQQLLHALILLAPFAANAHTDAGSFAERCEKLATQAQIRVVFEDRNVTRDDHRSREDLGRLSQANQNPYHSVLGLTHAEPFVKTDLMAQFLNDTDGRVCIVPSLTVGLGFSTLQVYLAKELKNSCRRGVVESHEQEHVAVWRNHFRAGARLLTSLFQSEFGHATYFMNREDANADVRQRVDKAVAFQLNNLKNGIAHAHQQIDSPAAYRYEEGRMRACP